MRIYDLNDIDNWDVPVQPQPESVPEKPAKKKRNIGLWILVFLLTVALVAEPFVLGMVRGEPVSVVGSKINDAGELVLYYSDGSSENLGVVVGADGKDGADGKNGMDGQNGLNGINGTDGVTTSTSNVATAAALGLRSAVSVWCTFYEEGWRGNVTEYYSAGSGVIYQINKSEGDAFVITNYHVVFDVNSRAENGIAEEIILYLYGSEISGREINATYVGGSQYYDIAVLRIEDSQVLRDSDAVAATVADSDAVQVGSTAIAVGNPEGGGISTSSGVISVDSEYITMTAADGMTSVSYRVMRIDTAVNSGNSGGGLYDDRGRLIGIVNAKTIDDGVENIGYALPSSSVVAVADNIIDYCFETDCESVQRAMLGVTVLTKDSYAKFDADTGMSTIVETVEIYEVTQGKLGEVFQIGDVLVSVTVGGTTKQVTRQHHIIDMLMTARPGDKVTFEVLRNGVNTSLTVTLTEDCLTAY